MKRLSIVQVVVLTLLGLLLSPSLSAAESWGTFSAWIDQCDYIAQYQSLCRIAGPNDLDQREVDRDGNRLPTRLVGRRLVRIYWQAKDAEVPDMSRDIKPWKLSDYDPKTDSLRTEFFSYGRGQHLWTAIADKGVIQFPGTTADPGVKMEFIGSDVEFDEVLRRAAELKKEGKKIAGNLELPVFGVK